MARSAKLEVMDAFGFVIEHVSMLEVKIGRGLVLRTGFYFLFIRHYCLSPNLLLLSLPQILYHKYVTTLSV